MSNSPRKQQKDGLSNLSRPFALNQFLDAVQSRSSGSW